MLEAPEFQGVGVPQVGVFSALIFSMVLRRLRESIPARGSVSMYTDDVLLFVTLDGTQDALALLLRAVECLPPWLRRVRLSTSIPKCQLCA